MPPHPGAVKDEHDPPHGRGSQGPQTSDGSRAGPLPGTDKPQHGHGAALGSHGADDHDRLHLAGGLVFAAYVIDPDAQSSRVGLLSIAAVMGCLAIGAVFMIHRRRPLTAWLALGALPSLLGAYLCFLH